MDRGGHEGRGRDKKGQKLAERNANAYGHDDSTAGHLDVDNHTPIITQANRMSVKSCLIAEERHLTTIAGRMNDGELALAPH